MTVVDRSRSWFLNLRDVHVQAGALETISESIFFHLWRTRQSPYSALQEGDTVYFLDRVSRRVTWELRVRHLRHERYLRLDDALTVLRQSFGLYPEDLSDYVLTRPDEGYLLAWAVEVVAAMDVPFPDEVDFGMLGARHGYLAWRDLPQVAARRLRTLPPPGRDALTPPAAWMVGDLDGPCDREPPTRYIPAHIRRQVLERDRGRCVVCGSAEPPLHVDHHYPFSKGGGNDLSNLRLLCQRHNLEKAAKVLMDAPVPAPRGTTAELRRLLGLSAGASLRELCQSALEAGREDELEPALVDEIYAALDGDVELPDINSLPLSTPLDGRLLAHLILALVEENWPVDDYTELLAALCTSQDRATRTRACLAAALMTPERELATRASLLAEAATSDDDYVRTLANVTRAYDMLAEEPPDDVASRALLEQAVECRDPGLRGAVALFLAQTEDDDRLAEELLRRALVSPNDAVVAEASVGLAELSGDNARAAGYARRALSSPDFEVRCRAHLVLGEIGGDGAAAHLNEASQSTNSSVRDAAREALERL